MALSVQNYPGAGFYRIRPAADPELALGIPGASTSDGTTVAMLAASDSDQTTVWRVVPTGVSSTWQLQNAGTGKYMDDRSHHGTTGYEVACQWSPHSVQSSTDWQAWISGGISSTVIWSPVDFASIPSTLIRASLATPVRGLDAFGSSSSILNEPKVQALSTDTTEDNIEQLWFMTPCDVFDPSIRGVDDFDVIVDERMSVSGGVVLGDPLARLSLSNRQPSGATLFSCIYVDGAEGCRARARARFIDPRTGDVSDWVKVWGDSTPTDPALADPDWGAAWEWRDVDDPVGYLAGAEMMSDPLDWSDAPSNLYSICELEVAVRRCGTSAGYVGPITTKSFRIARRPSLLFQGDGLMVSGEGIRLQAFYDTFYPGSYLRASISYDGEKIVDKFISPLSDPLTPPTTSVSTWIFIPWESALDVPVAWFTSTLPPEPIIIEIDLMTPYGVQSTSASHDSVRIGDGSIPAFSQGETIVDEQALHVGLRTSASYGLVVLPDGAGSQRVHRMWSRSILVDDDGKHAAVALSTPSDPAGLVLGPRKLVLLYLAIAQVGTDLQPWTITSSGAEEIDVSQPAGIASLSYLSAGVWHVLPIEGDLSIQHSISLPVSSAQSLGSSTYDVAVLAGETPTISLTGRIYMDDLHRVDLSTDAIEIDRGLIGVRGVLGGRKVLVRLPDGSALWAVVSSVDLPRVASRYADITLELLPVDGPVDAMED